MLCHPNAGQTGCSHNLGTTARANATKLAIVCCNTSFGDYTSRAGSDSLLRHGHIRARAFLWTATTPNSAIVNSVCSVCTALMTVAASKPGCHSHSLVLRTSSDS
eukprot:76297-Chlamydomonas_euryale.AAC.7